MLSFLNAKIWLYLQPIDFRKQLDGLIIEVAANLKKDPASGQWFIFRNKQGNKIKIILWERNGFWMLYKRVEKGRFQFPRNRDAYKSTYLTVSKSVLIDTFVLTRLNSCLIV